MSEHESTQGRAKEIIRAVKGNVVEGRLSMLIATKFQEATGRGLLPQTRWLYEGIGTACWRDTLMALSRLLERHHDGLTLIYLLDYSEQNPGEYPLATPEEVKQEVARQRARLASSSLWDAVQRLRNTTLAHTDRRHITDPPSVHIDPITTSAVEQAYDEALAIINALQRHLDGSATMLNNIDHLVKFDFEYLLSLFANARAEHDAKRNALLRPVRGGTGSP
jgi:hypothetical protein